MILAFLLSVPNASVWAADTDTITPPQPTEGVAVATTEVVESAAEDAHAEETPVSFSNSLFMSATANKLVAKNGKVLKDDSAFFCKDTREYVSSFDPETLLSRYLFFYKKGYSTRTNKSVEICAIYYRERYARTLFEVKTVNGKVAMTSKQMEKQYLEQLALLKTIKQGSYTLFGQKIKSNQEDKKALIELVSVIQEYWLTRFITFAHLERSREFALTGIGGVALSLGSIAGLVYFMAPKWADFAMKIPRLIGQLGMLARNTLVGTMGSGLGASFAAASDMPEQYNIEVWPSPLEQLNLKKDKVTIETENIGKDTLLKEAYAIGGSVAAGYLGWHFLSLGAEKAAGTEFVLLLRQGLQKSGGLLTKKVFFEAITALKLTNATEKTMVVMKVIRDSELMGALVHGYRALHLTSAIGSLIITDVMIHYLKEWIRERSTLELHESYQETQAKFKDAVQRFKSNPNDGELSLEVFAAAQKMFESLRLLASHLLTPSYQSVVEFSEKYRSAQTVPVTCSIAKMNVGQTDEHMIQQFLAELQKKERNNYLLAADSIDQFESTINETGLFFFTTFFTRKLSLLKISFFFDEKFGLETKHLSVGKNLKEFGKGYVRVLQGELAVNLQRMGLRLHESIVAAKEELGIYATSEMIQQYFNRNDDLNANLYEQCLNLEKTNPAKNPQTNPSSLQSEGLRRWRLGL